MAAPLSQKEIDDLLNSNFDDVGKEGESSPTSEKEATDIDYNSSDRVFRGEPRDPVYSSQIPYNSPVIKADEYDYNPDSNGSDKTIVESVFRYASRRNKNRH